MNRQQVARHIGEKVYLHGWPFMGPINTAEGKQYKAVRSEWGKEWTLLKLTKGGMAMITDGENTISVPPFYISTVTWSGNEKFYYWGGE